MNVQKFSISNSINNFYSEFRKSGNKSKISERFFRPKSFFTSTPINDFNNLPSFSYPLVLKRNLKNLQLSILNIYINCNSYISISTFSSFVFQLSNTLFNTSIYSPNLFETGNISFVYVDNLLHSAKQIKNGVDSIQNQKAVLFYPTANLLYSFSAIIFLPEIPAVTALV